MGIWGHIRSLGPGVYGAMDLYRIKGIQEIKVQFGDPGASGNPEI